MREKINDERTFYEPNLDDKQMNQNVDFTKTVVWQLRKIERIMLCNRSDDSH